MVDKVPGEPTCQQIQIILLPQQIEIQIQIYIYKNAPIQINKQLLTHTYKSAHTGKQTQISEQRERETQGLK